MHTSQYIMQDQVRKRVDAIMAYDLRHPHGRWRHHSKDLLISLVMAGLYAVVIAATA